MSDNTQLNIGTGGDLISSDDIAGVKVQRVKVQQGVDGSATDVSTTNPMPVTLANTGANATAVKTDSSATTQPVSASSLPLPTGASTAVKQPALGTAGSASADVLTVQGIASMTALKVDASATTQPISGTVTAKAQDGAGNALTSKSLGAERALSVGIVDASGTQITSFGGGTQYAEDAASAGGESLTLAGFVRQDTIASSTSADGDYANAKVDSVGRLYVNASGVAVPITDNSGSLTVDNAGTFATQATLQTGAAVIGALVADQTVNVTKLSGTAADTNSGVKSAGTLRVVLATDQPALTNKLLVTPDSVALPANQSVNVSQINGVTTTMGNGISGTGVQRVTLASDSTGQVALAAGAATVGSIAGITTSIVPGTGATNLGKAEDAAHVSGDVGILALGVRQDADTSPVSADGDYHAPLFDASGFLKVNIKAGAGSGGTAIVDNATFTRGTTSETPIGGVVETSAPTLTAGKAGALSLTTAGELRVNISSGGGSGGTAIADNATFTRGTTSETPIGGIVETSAPTLTTGKAGALSLTTAGELRVNVSSGGVAGFAEDAPHTSGDVGVEVLGVRRDADTSPVSADGDYHTPIFDANGFLKVNIKAGAGSGGTALADNATFTRGTTSETPIGGIVETSAPTLTTGKAGALSLTTGGALRADISSNFISTLPIETTPALPVFNAPQKTWRSGFDAVVASGPDTTFMTAIANGSGIAVSQSGGSLVITSGTTAYSETILRSVLGWNGTFKSRYSMTLSQRIVNCEVYVELVDVIGDALTIVHNSTTSVTVTIPSNPFTASNVGQGMYIGAISTASSLNQRATIASGSGNDVTFTGAGFAASGTGTCSLFGWNFHHIYYDGTTATTTKHSTQRNGWTAGDTTATINTTASGHLGVITCESAKTAYLDQLSASSTTVELVQRASSVRNVPEDQTTLRYQIRVRNLATAPASTTTVTVGFLELDQFVPQQVSLVGVEPLSANNALPTQVVTALPTGANIIGALTANQSVNVAQINAVTPLMGAGVTGTGSSRVTIATDGQGQLVDNAAFTDGTTRLDVAGYIFDEVAGTALTENDVAAGRIDSKRAQVMVVEDATTRGQRQAVSAAGAAATNLAQIAAATTLTGNGVTGTGSQRVTIASDNTAFSVNAVDAGVAAHGASISGNPVRLGGRALTADYTAVTAGQTADLITTLLGKLVTIPYANPNNTWSYAAASGGIVNTTGVTAKAAGGAGVRLYVTHASVINGHATVDTDVQIRDGASGTVLWRGFAKAAGGGVSESFDPPLRGTANTLLEIANGTTGSATYFNCQGFSASE